MKCDTSWFIETLPFCEVPQCKAPHLIAWVFPSLVLLALYEAPYVLLRAEVRQKVTFCKLTSEAHP